MISSMLLVVPLIHGVRAYKAYNSKATPSHWSTTGIQKMESYWGNKEVESLIKKQNFNTILYETITTLALAIICMADLATAAATIPFTTICLICMDVTLAVFLIGRVASYILERFSERWLDTSIVEKSSNEELEIFCAVYKALIQHNSKIMKTASRWQKFRFLPEGSARFTFFPSMQNRLNKCENMLRQRRFVMNTEKEKIRIQDCIQTFEKGDLHAVSSQFKNLDTVRKAKFVN